ncbi:MAG: molybdenum cofactor guanylyltransferase [Thermodesulfobacteriota bacterium]|nr:molybdenum cofactor guanylyltransferase [Thermodesulfobacteriota bacterium]
MQGGVGLTGIILSGGKSIRMGRNKAFIEIDGIPIIRRIYNLFENIFDEIIIVTHQRELFTDFKANIYNDLLPNRGALMGLYTGLFYSSHPYSFCVACDMPFLNKLLIQYLIDQAQDDDVIVPKTFDGLQPLHAIYSKKCLGPINKIIEMGKYKIIDFYPMVKIKIVGEDDILKFDPIKKSFVNINTPDELKYYGKETKDSQDD